MMLRFFKPLVSADALGFLLIVGALQTLTYGISSSVRGADSNYLFIVCLVGMLLAFGMSRSRFSGTEASAAIGAVGVLGVWILGARLTTPLLDLIRSILALIPQIIPAIHNKTYMDISHVVEAWLVILQASMALANRWQSWLIGVQNNSAVSDTLVRNMIWTLMMWLIAAWTGWFAWQRKAVLAMLPQLILLAAVISYSEYRVASLWLLLFIQLLLMGIWNYRNHTIRWERYKIDYSDSIRADNAQAVFLLAAFIGVLALVTPSISWRAIRDYFNRHTDNRAAELLGIQEQKVPSKNNWLPKPALPREHLLTEGFEQSQQIVMTIRTGELPPIPASTLNMDVPRHYWRGTVYDKYLGTGWVTSGWLAQNYRPNSPLIQGLLDGYRPLHLDVNMQQPQGKLFWSGILYSADVPFRVDWRVKPQSNLFADQSALLQADAFDVATDATSYHAETYVPAVSVETLRRASTDYPQEIRDRYLQLPKEVPQRVHQLAKEITLGNYNPYDKAKAIESYLRNKYPYDLKIPAPPQDRDVADYFLFDLKKGYCDYYATAMVVLARSSGLPARFVSGYSTGYYDSLNAQYIVRDLNAHSWPEIYFPQIGWIEFEPTAAQPEIKRLEKEIASPPATMPTTSLREVLFQLTSIRMLYWASPIGLALLLATLYYAFFDAMLVMSLAPQKAVQILYRRYYRLGRSLAGPREYSETAHEFTNKLIRYLEHSYHDAKPQDTERVKYMQNEMNRFTNLYSSILFSNHAVQRNDSRVALKIWRHLRSFMIIERIKRWLVRRNKTINALYKPT
jgi:hypothetical protein